MSFIASINIELKSASALSNSKSKTSATAIRNHFNKNVFPLYAHVYNVENSFIAVPPAWLRDLAEKAGEKEIATQIDHVMAEALKEKQRVIEDLQKQYRQKKLAK